MPLRAPGRPWSLLVTVVVLASVVAACSRGNGVRPTGSVVALPPPSTTGAMSLEQALAQRRSVRAFTAEPLGQAQVAQLLWAAQGENRPGRRTAPSAGALYPLHVYAVTADTVLEYRPAGHQALRWQEPGVQRQLAVATGEPQVVLGAPTVLVLTATPSVTRARYGSRGVRYVDLEAGHAAQNVLLQAVALGLAAVVLGSFRDDAVARALTLPGGEEPRYLVPVGHPAG